MVFFHLLEFSTLFHIRSISGSQFHVKGSYTLLRRRLKVCAKALAAAAKLPPELCAMMCKASWCHCAPFFSPLFAVHCSPLNIHFLVCRVSGLLQVSEMVKGHENGCRSGSVGDLPRDPTCGAWIWNPRSSWPAGWPREVCKGTCEASSWNWLYRKFPCEVSRVAPKRRDKKDK